MVMGFTKQVEEQSFQTEAAPHKNWEPLNNMKKKLKAEYNRAHVSER